MLLNNHSKSKPVLVYCLQPIIRMLYFVQPIIRMLCFVSDEGGFHNFKDGQEQIVHTRTQIYNKHTYKTLKASSALSRLGGAPPPPPAPAPIFPFSTYSWWKNVPTGRNLSSRSCQYLDARALAGKLNEVVPEAKFCQKNTDRYTEA